jgi:hypothetical protein
MKPFLKCGLSLHRSIQKAGLIKHKDSIYRKLRLKDEFCEKIRMFQSYPGEIVQSIFAHEIIRIHAKIKNGGSLTSLEVRLICWFATHHRSAMPFFVNYREVHFVRYDAWGEKIEPTKPKAIKPPEIKINYSNSKS